MKQQGRRQEAVRGEWYKWMGLQCPWKNDFLIQIHTNKICCRCGGAESESRVLIVLKRGRWLAQPAGWLCLLKSCLVVEIIPQIIWPAIVAVSNSSKHCALVLYLSEHFVFPLMLDQSTHSPYRTAKNYYAIGSILVEAHRCQLSHLQILLLFFFFFFYCLQ